MKKKYIPSEMEIVEFETEDIITKSGAGEGGDGTDDEGSE